MQFATNIEWYARAIELEPTSLSQLVARYLRELAMAGYVGAEMPTAHLTPLQNRLPVDFVATVLDACSSTGCRLVSSHGPTIPSFESFTVEQAVRSFVEQVDWCDRLRIPVLVIHPSHHPALHVTRNATNALAFDSEVLNELAKRIQRRHVSVAVENVPTNSWGYLSELLQRVTAPEIAFCYDTGHQNVRPERTIKQVVSEYGPRLIHLHFSDNDGLSDQHLPPGDGNINWAEVLTSVPNAAKRSCVLERTGPMLRDCAGAAAQDQISITRAIERARSTLG